MNASARAGAWSPVMAGDAGARQRMTGKRTVVAEVWALTREYVARVYLAFARRVWRRLPPGWPRSRAALAAGSHLHRLVLRYQPREQNHSTFFFRNRAELALLTGVLDAFPRGARLTLAILGCSKGAEVYSFAWAIRSARPDLQLALSAVDISQDVLDFAQQGTYWRGGRRDAVDGESDDLSRRSVEDAEAEDAAARDVAAGTDRDQPVSIFDRVTPEEMAGMFDLSGDQAMVKPWLKDGIVWRRGDAGGAQFARRLGGQDIVVANRFLCHMKPAAAERCLRAIARLVKPGGYLFVSGVDLDVRARVAHDRGWTPITDRLEGVHDGDRSLLEGWPLEYWSIEPFQATHPDRDVRYASVFNVGKP
jgi:chemotaxis methyl-accepting protein methylase